MSDDKPKEKPKGGAGDGSCDFGKWCKKKKIGMKGNNGKGDSPRPVDEDVYRSNYDDIFRKAKNRKKNIRKN